MSRSAVMNGFAALMPATLGTYDSEAPLDGGKVRRESYVILFDLGADDPPNDERFTKAQEAGSAVTWRILARSVGETPFAAREVDQAVAAAAVGKVLTMLGRRCLPIRLDDVGHVQRDTDVSPPLYFIESEYLVRSEPT